MAEPNPQILQEALNTPLNPQGTGEDAAVREFLQKPSGQFTSEDVDVMKAMLKTMQGGSLTKVQEENAVLAKELMEKREKLDKMMDENQQRFNNMMEEMGNRLRLSPEGQAKVQAQAVEDLATATAALRSKNTSLTERLKHEEQIQVVWPANPRPLFTREGGRIQPVEIRLGSSRYCYPIGSLVKVPRTIADLIDKRNREEDQNAARKKSFTASENSLKSVPAAAADWQKVSDKYGLEERNPFLASA